MLEGWSGDQYYTLFDAADYPSLTQEYGVEALLFFRRWIDWMGRFPAPAERQLLYMSNCPDPISICYTVRASRTPASTDFR
jgi:hypothetical protein